MNDAINPVVSSLGFPCPLTLKCVLTGKENTFADPEYIRQRIAKAGSLENLYKTYLCKAGKKLQKEQQLRGVAADREPGKGTSATNPTDESASQSGRCRQASHDLATGTLHHSETWTNGTVMTVTEHDDPSRGRTVLRSFKYKDGTVCNVYAHKDGT